MLEVLLRHREHIPRIGEEHITPLLILGHILILALLEVLQFSVIVTLNPTGLIEMHDTESPQTATDLRYR